MIVVAALNNVFLFCLQICQKYHWFVHKKHCAKMKKLADDREEERKKKEKENADKEKSAA